MKGLEKSILLYMFLIFCGAASAAIELPAFFTDNMVFQREKPISIWGTAGKQQRLTCGLGPHTAKTVTDENGRWEVEFSAMQAGGPYELILKTAADQQKLSGVYIGDVWVFSGQSNMQVSFEYFLDLPNIVDRYKECFQKTLDDCAQDTLVRNYMVATKDNKETIRNEAENKWLLSTPEGIKHCNPIAYYFAREVSQKTHVMTAAVRIAWGGQYIERFYRGAAIYENMLKPWGRFPVKGVIWYQGENNLYKDGDRLGYALKLQLLIRDYRALWNDPKLPFLIVQLPPSTYSSRPFNDQHSLPVFLEAQRQALAIPFTAMANTADLGMDNGLHQPQKYDVAVRLANLAFANVYGFADAVAAGPQYKNHVRQGNKLRINFETFGSTLVTRDGKAPAFFELLPAGSDQTFVKAHAEIDGSSVLVWHENVSDPVDVRFAFREQDLMEINLTNAAGIPAATFWAGATRQLHPALDE